MANSLFDYDDSSPPPAVDPWNDNSQYAPTPGDFGRSPTLSSISPSPDRILPQEEPNQLVFHPLTGWKEGGEYNQESLKYICYTIAWKLVLNDKTVGRVTEEDLVVAPSDYWKRSLKASLEDMLQTKKKCNQRVRSEGTAITVSVDERSLKDFEKFYNSTNIDWTLVEKQLCKWSNLLCNGKILRVIIAFYYGHDDSSLSILGRVDKRGPVSATRRMLAECDV